MFCDVSYRLDTLREKHSLHRRSNLTMQVSYTTDYICTVARTRFSKPPNLSNPVQDATNGQRLRICHTVPANAKLYFQGEEQEVLDFRTD